LYREKKILVGDTKNLVFLLGDLNIDSRNPNLLPKEFILGGKTGKSRFIKEFGYIEHFLDGKIFWGEYEVCMEIFGGFGADRVWDLGF
jgi:hypothetical protein